MSSREWLAFGMGSSLAFLFDAAAMGWWWTAIFQGLWFVLIFLILRKRLTNAG